MQGNIAAEISSKSFLIVSPHLDDAVYSCSALLQRHPSLTVLTVLAGAPSPPLSRSWDQHCGFVDSDQAVAARRAEEQDAFVDTQHDVLHLPLLDAQYLDDGRPPSEEDLVVGAVNAWVERVRSTGTGRPAVLIPIGAGVLFQRIEPPSHRTTWGRMARRLVGRPGKAVFHWLRRTHQNASIGADRVANADHIWVRDAVLDRFADSPEVDICFYEDYPYLLSRSGDTAAVQLERRVGPLSKLSIDVDRSRKRDAMRCYRSQVSADPTILDEEVLPSAERFWIPAGSPVVEAAHS